MTDSSDPWLVAAWPGMGTVALTAGAHLVRALEAEALAELGGRAYFDLDHVEVAEGIASAARPPRQQLFALRTPRRELLALLGEAQPSHRGADLCAGIVSAAAERGVRRIITFAAMAGQTHPQDEPGVLAAATNPALRDELARHGAQPLAEGQISGLNGLLLAVAAERGIEAACLLGEIPYFAAGVPNPKASLAVLRVFASVAGLRLDLTALEEESRAVEEQLVHLLEQLSAVGEHVARHLSGEEDREETSEAGEEPREPDLDLAARQRIEELFAAARRDRARAVELKKELDRHGAFDAYEDRFLDLFKKGE